MRPIQILGLLAALGVQAPAHAYCINNLLADREVRVQQDPHTDRLREDRTLDWTLKPGERRCCTGRNLDCNPAGRRESVVSLKVVVRGSPEYQCGTADGKEYRVKVTGGGLVRIMENPRHTPGGWPYIVRVRTHDKDLTGPRGVQCPEIKDSKETPSKGKP